MQQKGWRSVPAETRHLWWSCLSSSPGIALEIGVNCAKRIGRKMTTLCLPVRGYLAVMTGMTNKIDGGADLDGVIRELTDGFTEALVTAAEGVHA